MSRVFNMLHLYPAGASRKGEMLQYERLGFPGQSRSRSEWREYAASYEPRLTIRIHSSATAASDYSQPHPEVMAAIQSFR